MSRVTNDVDTISQTLNQSIGSLVTAITMFVGSLLLMFITNYAMAVAAVVSTIIGFIIMFLIMSKSQKYFVRQQNELGRLNGHIEEIYSGHNVVKVYNGERKARETVSYTHLGALSVKRIVSFSDYHAVNQQLLSQMINQMDQVKTAAKSSSEKMISADTGIKSGKKGFEFLNELFIKRHKKILWKSSVRLTAVCLFLVLGCLLAFYIRPEIKSSANELLMTFLPYFVFIMYAINRGTGFTRALFMNCDHSLLTYSFYKQPKMVLKLFAIRLREIVKINLLPAAVLGGGLAALLYASGGTDNPINLSLIHI